MHEIHIHSGLVWIRDADGLVVYQDTIENFATDCPVEGWALPEEAHERYYMTSDRHFVMFGKREQTFPLPWAAGDQILASIETIVANQAARIEVDSDGQ